MRRGQKRALKSILHRQTTRSWFPSGAPDTAHGPSPLGHKLVRILRRLASGEWLMWIRGVKAWKWAKGGKVKAAWLFTLKALGLANVIHGTWAITAAGVTALGAARKAA